MTKNRVIGGLVFGFTIITAIAGCKLVNLTPAVSASVYTGPAPALYSLSPSGNVVNVSVDRNAEGVVLGASLDEVEMPDAWAKVTKTLPSGNYYLYNKQVYPTGIDAPDFLLTGVDYYPKFVQLGLDTNAKIFAASESGSEVVYTPTDATDTMIFPSTTLTPAQKKWYWEQMALGDYYLLTQSKVAMTGIDFSLVSDGSAAFSGASKTNRWFKSAHDPVWKAGRDSAVGYLTGKVLVGTGNLVFMKNSGTWIMGTDETSVSDTWNFDSYYKIFLEAYTSTGSLVDTVTAPSAKE